MIYDTKREIYWTYLIAYRTGNIPEHLIAKWDKSRVGASFYVGGGHND